MDVSIIIPTLNEAQNILRAAEGAWRAGASEVLVADGGSRDSTVELAAGAGCRVVRAAPGRAAQQNAAAGQASGEVFLFQHADNWLEPGAVGQIEAALARRDAQGGAFRQKIDADGYLYRCLEAGNGWRARWLGLPYGDQGIFLRRSCFLALGGFPEVTLMEDVLLMKKLRRVSRPLLLPGPMHVHPRRWQRYGVVRQTLRNWSLRAAHQLGVPPHRLARFYPRHDSV